MRPRRKKSVGKKEIPLYEKHTLFWRATPWHHFGHDAYKQEPILDEFQKRGWPDSVEISEFPEKVRKWSKPELRATLKDLNRSLGGAIHFRLEGSGSRICWEAL